MSASEAEQHTDASPIGPVVATVPIPPELIVASGVGREVTNWHREVTKTSDARETGKTGVDQGRL